MGMAGRDVASFGIGRNPVRVTGRGAVSVGKGLPPVSAVGWGVVSMGVTGRDLAPLGVVERIVASAGRAGGKCLAPEQWGVASVEV